MMQKVKDLIKDINWRTKAFVWSLGFSCAISIMIFSIMVQKIDLGNPIQEVAAQNLPNPFDSVALEGKSAYVWDSLTGQVLYQKNADEKLPLASLTKVMTALTAAKYAPASEKVTIALDDLSPEGDSLLKVATSWDMKSLIDYVLLVSSNDGAHALAATVGALGNQATPAAGNEIASQTFIAEMNALAHELGFSSMTFVNEHG